ncbi:MAG: transcription antitermination factor NusB [Nitrospiraceae bacterium]|jgi:N utilization substance protein B|nr:transcription antitermination factor NusB [Nitrospiraceae bacterium]
MKRRNAREYALQFLYQIDFLEVGASEHALRDTLGTFWAGVTEKDGDVRAFTEDLILGTIGNLTPIDREIQRAADKWDLGRMASVDRTILRIGAYELLYRPDIPGAVSINEAIEIAKKYSTADSASFINGLLDRIAREVRSGEKKNAKKPLQS